MSQIFPNFTRPDSLGGPAPIQTMRVSHSINGTEQSNGYADLAVALQFPFADNNYTVLVTVEGGPSHTGEYAGINLKTASGFIARVVSQPGGQLWSPGDTYTLHILAIHD
jgi:hypothetical protein